MIKAQVWKEAIFIIALTRDGANAARNPNCVVRKVGVFVGVSPKMGKATPLVSF